MVEIKELTYILAIAREGSISRAAEKLYMSQPNLSQFLKNFEASIGTVLFYRTPPRGPPYLRRGAVSGKDQGDRPFLPGGHEGA